jgi:hypothetical protein
MPPRIFAIVIAASGLASLSVAAAPSGPASLASQAKVSRADAQRTALARVPAGIVKSVELEREHGALVWSFDIAAPGTMDIHEIQVDARSGAIVSTEIETPKDQARERAADRREHASMTGKH